MKKQWLKWLCSILAVLTLAGCSDKKADSLAERVVLMSGGELAELSQWGLKRDKIEELLDEDGALYRNDGMGGLLTTTTDTFLGYDCIYGFGESLGLGESIRPRNDYFNDGNVNVGYSAMYSPYFYISFADDAQFKEGRQAIEELFEGGQEKGFEPLKSENEVEVYGESTRYTTYILEATDRDIEKWENAGGNAERFKDKKIYKCVDLAFIHLSERQADAYFSMFPKEKSYTSNVCVGVVYLLTMSEEEWIWRTARDYQYDAAGKKAIDLEPYGSVQSTTSRKSELTRLYFMDHYGFDLASRSYVKDRGARELWCAVQFGWDSDRKAVLDLKDYGDSLGIYCAVKYNYNMDRAEYFGDEKERGLYLALNYGWDADTGAALNLKNYEDSLRVYCAVKYNYDMNAGIYFRSSDIGEEIRSAKVDDIVTFGSYEQDNDFLNGSEPIEWLVLDRKDGKVLLLSRYGLDCKKYNEEFEDITWETCTLRRWLNVEFYRTAFREVEQKFIAMTNVKNADNPYFGTEGGRDTEDRVFLLSIEEATTYFNPDPEAADLARQVRATEYAKWKGAMVYREIENGIYGTVKYDGNSAWWLRSSGYKSNGVADVYFGGNIFTDGTFANGDNLVVRPALWLNLEPETPEHEHYRAGVYTSAIELNEASAELEIVLDSNRINSIRFISMEESFAAMYPLMESALQELAEQLTDDAAPEDVVWNENFKYTQMLLMEVINAILEKAEVE